MVQLEIWSFRKSVALHHSSGIGLFFWANMKLFVALKNYYKVFDIRPNQKHLFNIKSVSALFIIAYSFGASAYLLFENTNFVELGNLSYGSLTFLFILVVLFTTILKQAKMFKFIDEVEMTIEKSEFQFVKLEFQFQAIIQLIYLQN